MPQIQDESGWEVVYTDGACQGNGQKGAVAGIGVWWGNNDSRNVAERCPGAQTNNRAELIAIIRALELAPKGIKQLLIKTDSVYSIKCIQEWMPAWRGRGWKTSDGNPVKNKEIIMYLAHLLDEYGRRRQLVHLQHVRGHAGEMGNEGADGLAGLGATMPAQPDRDWTIPPDEDPRVMGKDTVVKCKV
ncbi:hypothetical protein M422DRAFT_172567 [Sphaerobolus stellatus SS14]|uniref:ribonuclease H n=1 Tax=Sphaerobolus stellatus (strain SS14) TaxID=990650 RepID=A0A0C9VSW5_SPHS4|nr:hypothetical protein M422DRAFT_172567 [Sphaerobolus stellatus SS14]